MQFVKKINYLLLIISEIAFLLSYYTFLVTLWQHEPVFSVLVILRIACLSLTLFFLSFALIKMARAGVFSAVFLLTTLMVIFARTNYLRLKLIPLQPEKATMSKIVLFDRQNRETILFLLSSNRMTGVLLTTFFILGAPLNCTLFATLLKAKLEQSQLQLWIISSVVFVSQLTVFIAFHLLAAKVELILSNPYRQFISQYCHISQCSLCYRLKAALAIEAFYNKNPYGLTYGRLGLITMATVGKCFFIYSQIIFNFL